MHTLNSKLKEKMKLNKLFILIIITFLNINGASKQEQEKGKEENEFVIFEFVARDEQEKNFFDRWATGTTQIGNKKKGVALITPLRHHFDTKIKSNKKYRLPLTRIMRKFKVNVIGLYPYGSMKFGVEFYLKPNFMYKIRLNKNCTSEENNANFIYNSPDLPSIYKKGDLQFFCVEEIKIDDKFIKENTVYPLSMREEIQLPPNTKTHSKSPADTSAKSFKDPAPSRCKDCVIQ